MGFNADILTGGRNVVIRLSGDLDATAAPGFYEILQQAATNRPRTLALTMHDLNYISSAGLRGLVFARQNMGDGVEIVVEGANETVTETIRMTGLDHAVVLRQVT
jgi:anti-anti-sigma factor